MRRNQEWGKVQLDRMYDVIIVGAGIIGCAVAFRLAEYTGNIAVIDKGHDVTEGASKANSGIIHAGYDAAVGSDKARLNVKGAKMYPGLCARLGVPYGNPGALVIAFDDEELAFIQELSKQAELNGVMGCRVVSRNEAVRMEPNVNPSIMSALYIPSSGLVSPYEMTYALADSAKENGVEFLLDTTVRALLKVDDYWVVETNKGSYAAKTVVNCAGVGAGELHNSISSKRVNIIPRRGQYYLLDKDKQLAFRMTLFQVPTSMGKGVLVTPTTHGNVLLGPTAEDIQDPFDTATTRSGLDEAFSKVKKTWPDCTMRNVITTFSGIRAHEEGDDFIVGTVEGAPDGAFEAIGIESPGLSAAPAIGEELGDWVAWYLKLPMRGDYRGPKPLPKAFSYMSNAERAEAYAQNPEYGRIVCRCEQVTEAEVRYAIRRPCGARSVDGVKRRTRAGMGRCQGGFCSTRVAQILSEELGQDLLSITKLGGESFLLTDELKPKSEGRNR